MPSMSGKAVDVNKGIKLSAAKEDSAIVIGLFPYLKKVWYHFAIPHNEHLP